MLSSYSVRSFILRVEGDSKETEKLSERPGCSKVGEVNPALSEYLNWIALPRSTKSGVHHVNSI